MGSSGRARRLRLSSAFLTATWLVLCWLYIASEVGWPVLNQLLPSEMGLVVTGVLAPLALLWAMTLAETRADTMAAELSRQVALLLATPAAAVGRLESGTDTLERRARILAEIATQTSAQLEQATARLEAALQRGMALRLELDRSIDLLDRQLDRAALVAEASGRQLATWQTAFAGLPPVEPRAGPPVGRQVGRQVGLPPPSRWRRLLALFDEPAAKADGQTNR